MFSKIYFSIITFLIILVVIKIRVSAKSNGGPTDDETCTTMLPRHGAIQPQKTPFPYTIYLSKSELKAGESVKIQICSSKIKFKGFYLQARKENYMKETTPMGTFAYEEGHEKSTKLTKCSVNGDKGQDGNTITHSHSMDKDNVTVQWTSPAIPGTYVILCTVVKNGVMFWKPEPSFKISVK